MMILAYLSPGKDKAHSDLGFYVGHLLIEAILWTKQMNFFNRIQDVIETVLITVFKSKATIFKRKFSFHGLVSINGYR